jgi:hypothetical protein
MRNQDIETLKAQVLNQIRLSGGLDLSNHPVVVFYRNLQWELSQRELPEEIIDQALRMEVRLTALGVDATPHLEWLSEMASAYAASIQNMATGFGPHLQPSLLKQIEQMSLTL